MKNTLPDEIPLLQSAQSGDLDAFNQLVLMYQDTLFRTALNILGDEDAAADAAQDTFISAFRKLGSFRGGSFRSWLTRVTINLCYDQLRRKWRHPTFNLEPDDSSKREIDTTLSMADPAPQPQDEVETWELGDAIQGALKKLDPKYRVVSALVDMEGCSYEEAADILHVPVGTIKSRLAQARLALRTFLGNFPELPAWNNEQIREMEVTTLPGWES